MRNSVFGTGIGVSNFFFYISPREVKVAESGHIKCLTFILLLHAFDFLFIGFLTSRVWPSALKV